VFFLLSLGGKIFLVSGILSCGQALLNWWTLIDERPMWVYALSTLKKKRIEKGREGEGQGTIYGIIFRHYSDNE